MVSKQFTKRHKNCIVKERAKQGNNSSSNGYVLIFVLWAIAILSMVALGFSKDTKVSVLLKSVSAERIKDFYAARGASLYALVKMSSGNGESSENSVSNQQATGTGGLVESENFPTEGTAPVSGDDHSEDDESEEAEEEEAEENGKQSDVKWIPGRNPYSVRIGDVDCDVYLFPENGKININGIDDNNREIFVNFLTKKGVDMLDADIITDSILDWTDDDDLKHINGAEDQYYGSLPDSYKSKDASFFSIEELTLVRGITPEIFEKIKDDITVYGDEKVIININIASKEILSSLPGLTDGIVDELSLYIEENGSIKTAEELREVFWDLGVIGSSFEKIRPYLTFDQTGFVTISAVSKGFNETPEQPGKSNLTSVKNRYNGYDYKMIVGKKDGGYEIYAVYPE